MSAQFSEEVKKGKRFEFGKNWQNFSLFLNDQRIAEAELSLKKMLDLESLEGKSFLDIGSGSGLFSLAARRLGARVHSFDYDSDCVTCTQELKRRFFLEDDKWVIEQASVLDINYMKSLGQFDIVYSWGVLHHTGSMWQALNNTALAVTIQGKIFIAIYNDQGSQSKLWLMVKRFYCSGLILKLIILALIIPFFITGGFLADVFKKVNPINRYLSCKNKRGMRIFNDWFDWLGGLPFEVAKPEEIFSFFNSKDFVLKKLKTVSGKLGCNEYVFLKQEKI